jgi:succinyl-diaminopimelate desuccinylase
MTAPDPSRMKADLARLVGMNSSNPPGDEHEAAEFIATLLREVGFSVMLDPFKPGRTNVVATLANGDGPVFAFNTHMDVVPAGEGWSSPAFHLRESDGKLFGRGACDAKGPLIAMVEGLRMLATDPGTWRGTLLGVFVADEEVGSEGARRYVAGRPKVDYVVIGEPTSNATVIAHKGSLRPVIRVHGISAHSSTPDLGDNAIYNAARFVTLVEQHYLTVVRLRTHALVGNATLTVTRFNAGLADNVIPDHCDLMLDRRLVPGEQDDQVKQEIADLLSEAKARFNIDCECLRYHPTTGGATETPPDAAIVTASLAGGARYGVTNNKPLGFQGGCDLVHFRSIGALGTVVGPGSLAVAHKPDEYVPVGEFVSASLIYRDIAATMLGRT